MRTPTTAAAPRARILVATRDPATARSLLGILRSLGMEVTHGDPGRGQPLDPGFDTAEVLLIEAPAFGEEEQALLELARERSPLLEVILILDKPPAEGAVEAFRSGVFAVLEHPYTRDQLELTIAGACSRRRRGEERIQQLDRKENE